MRLFNTKKKKNVTLSEVPPRNKLCVPKMLPWLRRCPTIIEDKLQTDLFQWNFHTFISDKTVQSEVQYRHKCTVSGVVGTILVQYRHKCTINLGSLSKSVCIFLLSEIYEKFQNFISYKNVHSVEQ